MNRLILTLLSIIALFSCGSAMWATGQQHQYGPSASKQVADGIKQKLLENVKFFSGTDFQKQLEADLNQGKDSKRTLKTINVLNAVEILKAVGFSTKPTESERVKEIEDYIFKCHKDANKNQLTGDELKCLNIIWKIFLPK